MAFNSLLVMEITIAELEEAQRGLQAELEKLRDGKRGAMAALLSVLGRTARPLSPIRTGRLRNSIFEDVLDGGNRGALATNVTYAPYQEYGTSRGVPAVRFFGRTVSQSGSEAVRAYQSVLLGK